MNDKLKSVAARLTVRVRQEQDDIVYKQRREKKNTDFAENKIQTNSNMRAIMHYTHEHTELKEVINQKIHSPCHQLTISIVAPIITTASTAEFKNIIVATDKSSAIV